MFLLILDSLGNSELLVILVAALIFFGPRKLPQLSRSVGKSLSEFRRASDDFKRTWAQEVALESDAPRTIAKPSIATADGNTVQRERAVSELPEVPTEGTEPVTTDVAEDGAEDSEARAPVSRSEESPKTTAEPLRKQDWL
jgi:TatA/E family protein of Tat protein translocase